MTAHRMIEERQPDLDNQSTTHLVEVLQHSRKTSQDALGNANEKVSIVVVAGRVGQGTKSLEEGNQEATKANGSKGGGDGTDKAIVKGGGATGFGFLWFKPPSANRSSNNNVNCVLRGMTR